MIKPIIQFRNFSFQYESQAEKTLKKINLDIYPVKKFYWLELRGQVNQHWDAVLTD